MAAMKPRTGDGPMEVTKEGRGIVMRVPLEGGGRLVVELNADEAAELAGASAGGRGLSSDACGPVALSGRVLLCPSAPRARRSIVTASQSSQAVNDILAAAGLPGRVRILDRPAPTARRRRRADRLPGRGHRQLAGLRHGRRRAGADHDQRSRTGSTWTASGTATASTCTGRRPTSSAPTPASRSAASLPSAIRGPSAPWSTATWPRTTSSGRPAASRTRCSR